MASDLCEPPVVEHREVVPHAQAHLKARPIYPTQTRVQRRPHLTIVFSALVVARLIEDRTGC
jgi:hypothetical protein